MFPIFFRRADGQTHRQPMGKRAGQDQRKPKATNDGRADGRRRVASSVDTQSCSPRSDVQLLTAGAHKGRSQPTSSPTYDKVNNLGQNTFRCSFLLHRDG